MKRNIILWASIPIFSTLYQVSVKLAAGDLQQMDFGLVWVEHIFTMPWMWAALVSEMSAFVIWMKILAHHDLSKAFPLSAMSYVLVLCTSWFGFHETILSLQLLGGILILFGVWLIGTADNFKESDL